MDADSVPSHQLDLIDGIDRIVVINDYTVPVGGAGMLAMQSVSLYRGRGLPVTVITGQSCTPELKALGVDVVGLNSKGLLKVSRLTALRQGYHNADAAQMIASWIEENDTPGTVYHLNNWSQILSPAIFKSLECVANRTIITCHDFFNVCPNGSFIDFQNQKLCNRKPLSAGCLACQCDRRSTLHKYWRIARQLHLNNTAKFEALPYTFTVIHKRMLERFQEAGFPASDMITLPNPVAPWSNSRIAAEQNQKFLFVGRIGPDKGTDIALDATKTASAPITIIGSGENDAEMASAYPHANFVGWCNREQILQHARQARALIVPSRVVEPFGLVVLEAAMSGIPIIVSDRAYLSDNVEEMNFGVRVDVNDGPGLASLINDLASDHERIESMSRNGHKNAHTLCHSPSSWIDSFLGLFQRKLNASARTGN